MRKKTLIIIGSVILVVALSAALSAVFQSMKPEVVIEDKEDIKRYVKAVTVEYGDHTSLLKEKGRVASQNYIDLSSSGRGPGDPPVHGAAEVGSKRVKRG